MTAKQILDETIQYYSEDPNRVAKTDEGCSYFKDNKECAVGRCLINSQEIETLVSLSEDFFEEHLGGSDAENLNELLKTKGSSLEEKLQEKYRGHKINFWMKLQALHDRHDWTMAVSEEQKQRILDADL